MRNQNIYTARVTQGLYVAAPGNAKPLGRIQRAFVVYAENNTYDARTFRMSIASQPTGGSASFKQFAQLTQLDVTIGPRLSVSRTVYVRSTDPRALVTVDVREVSGGVIVLPTTGGLQGTAALNPDTTNPDMMNPDMMNPDMMNPDVLSAEVYTPDMMNPDMMNPDMMNPDMMNPDMMNPDMMNPDMMNPDMMNPDMMNPDMMNPTPTGDVNATILNPDMMNPDMMNADPTNAAMTDTVWTLTNNGNTTAAYDVKMLLRGNSEVPDGFKTQLLLYKTYLTPVARECELTQETQNVLIASVPNPPFGHVGDTVIFNPADGSLGHTTLWLAPGESAKITLRVLDPDRHDDVAFDPVTEVTPATAPQPVDTTRRRRARRPRRSSPPLQSCSWRDRRRHRSAATSLRRCRCWSRTKRRPIAEATVTLSLATNPGGATLNGGTATSRSPTGSRRSASSGSTGSAAATVSGRLWERTLPGQRVRSTSCPSSSPPTPIAGPGSLRAAIENANRNAGYADRISFAIPGGGVHRVGRAAPCRPATIPSPSTRPHSRATPARRWSSSTASPCPTRVRRLGWFLSPAQAWSGGSRSSASRVREWC